jgi:ParB family chromosome partitioning protein
MSPKPKNSAAFLDSVLSGIDTNPPTAPPTRPREETSRVPIIQEIERAGQGAFERLTELERQIEQDKKNGRLIVELDPAKIRRGRFTDRDPSFIHDEEFARLRASIQKDGQLMPVGVREAAHDGDGAEYETVWGHRRIAACRELGRPVRAVILQSDDLRAAVMGFAENARRANTSLIEQGRLFTALISDGMFAHQRDLAQTLEISDAQVSTAVRVAEIPEDILEALGDWRQCTARQALALRKAIDVPEGLERMRVAAVAPSFQQLKPGADSTLKSRIALLCAAAQPAAPAASTERRRAHSDARGRQYATMEADRFGSVCRFPKSVEPGFVEFFWERLPELRAEFESRNAPPPSEPKERGRGCR